MQLQAELDSTKTEKRLARLEDPISALHDDVPELAGTLYKAVIDRRDNYIQLTDDLYERYRRPLALLDAEQLIHGTHTLSKRFGGGITLSNAVFFMYMCALHEDQEKMKKLIALIDQAELNQWLDGKRIARAEDLPSPTVKAVFEVYAARGLGILSRTVGEVMYRPTA